MSGFSGFVQRWFGRPQGKQSAEEAEEEDRLGEIEEGRIDGSTDALGIGVTSRPKTVTNAAAATAAATRQGGKASSSSAGFLSQRLVAPSANAQQNTPDTKSSSTFDNPHGASSSIGESVPRAKSGAGSYRTNKFNAPSLQSMTSRLGGYIDKSSSARSFSRFRRKNGDGQDEAIVAPSSTDRETMDLAQRLEEIEMAVSDGMLDEDEARMLRASVFEKSLSSPERRPRSAATRERTGKNQPSPRPDTFHDAASSIKDGSETATLHTVRTKTSTSARFANFLDSASSLGRKRFNKAPPSTKSSMAVSAAVSNGRKPSKPAGLLASRQMSSRSVASTGLESNLTGRHSEFDEVNPSETAGELRQEIETLKRELRRVLQAWDGVELKLLREGASKGVGSGTAESRLDAADHKAGQELSSDKSSSPNLSHRHHHAKKSSKDSDFSLPDLERERAQKGTGSTLMPLKSALRQSDPTSTVPNGVPDARPALPPKDVHTPPRQTTTSSTQTPSSKIDGVEQASRASPTRSNGSLQRTTSGESSGTMNSLLEIIGRVPFTSQMSPKGDPEASSNTSTKMATPHSPQSKHLSARFAEETLPADNAKSLAARRDSTDAQLTSLYQQLEKVRGKRVRMQAKYQKRIELLEAKLKAAEIRDRSFGLFGGKG